MGRTPVFAWTGLLAAGLGLTGCECCNTWGKKSSTPGPGVSSAAATNSGLQPATFRTQPGTPVGTQNWNGPTGTGLTSGAGATPSTNGNNQPAYNLSQPAGWSNQPASSQPGSGSFGGGLGSTNVPQRPVVNTTNVQPLGIPENTAIRTPGSALNLNTPPTNSGNSLSSFNVTNRIPEATASGTSRTTAPPTSPTLNAWPGTPALPAAATASPPRPPSDMNLPPLPAPSLNPPAGGTQTSSLNLSLPPLPTPGVPSDSAKPADFQPLNVKTLAGPELRGGN